jgi:uncharacterized membrane protein
VFTLSPTKRRIVYVATFELIAIILSTYFLMFLSGTSAENSLPVAVMVSFAAVVWNFLFNTGFEAWERKKNIQSRTFWIRCIHSAGFECGLIILCLPIYVLWYSVGLWEAFTMEFALLLFFLVYTFVFTLLFDKVFTLPQHVSA